MKNQLIDVGLWRYEDAGDPGGDIASAWSVLSRTGCPGRYCGRTQDGLHEYMIVDPKSGALMTSGKGDTLAIAICKAALAACTLCSNQLELISGHQRKRREQSSTEGII